MFAWPCAFSIHISNLWPFLLNDPIFSAIFAAFINFPVFLQGTTLVFGSWLHLGAPGAVLGVTWMRFGRSGRGLGRPWGTLGPLLGRSWALLGRSWGLLEAS